jgi:hypothetical protein
MKCWAGGAREDAAKLGLLTPLQLKPPEDAPYSRVFDLNSLTDNPLHRGALTMATYSIYLQSGERIQTGTLNGQTLETFTKAPEKIRCEIGSGAWEVEEDTYNEADIDALNEGVTP